MEGLRVIFLSSHAELGGQEAYLLTLLRNVDPDLVDGVVALTDGPFMSRLAQLGVPLWLVPTPARIGILAAALRLRRILRSRRPELVHANGFKAALTSALALEGTDIPVLWMKHDCSLDGPLARAVATRCRVVVGVSRAVTAALEELRHADVRVVPNGVRPFAFDRAAARVRLRSLASAAPGAEIVLQVARLTPNKGQQELLAVTPVVLERRPRAHVVFIGDADSHTPEHAGRLRACAAELGRRITFLGHQDDAVELIAGADVLAMPSLAQPGFYGWREGFGLVALEAMMVGTPVVAYDEAGVRETLAGCGRLVRTGDRAQLGATLLDVLGDPKLRERMIACGTRRAGELSLDTAVARMEAVYREVARRSHHQAHY